MHKEGVIKFNGHWIQKPPFSLELIEELNNWRQELFKRHLIGKGPDGIGFGNISQRYGGNQFFISGTGTGVLPLTGPESYTLVTGYDFELNSLTCEGPIQASSESLSHAAIYRSLPAVETVFHIHSASLWKGLLREGKATAEGIAYGTPEMAVEIGRILSRPGLEIPGILAMAGHEDGILAFGASGKDCFGVILGWLDRA